MRRLPLRWLILIVLILLALDILLAVTQAQRASCTDVDDPRFSPPAESCGLSKP